MIMITSEYSDRKIPSDKSNLEESGTLSSLLAPVKKKKRLVAFVAPNGPTQKMKMVATPH